MGKYSKLKNSMAKFTQPEDWQQKIDKIKTKMKLKSKKPVELSALFTESRNEKDRLNELIKDQNTILEAIQQVSLEKMDELDMTSFKDQNGDTFFIKDDPYCAVEDKQAFNDWVIAEKLTDLFSVNYQTVAAMSKERLIEGKPLPPGIKVYMKSSLQRREAKG